MLNSHSSRRARKPRGTSIQTRYLASFPMDLTSDLRRVVGSYFVSCSRCFRRSRLGGTTGGAPTGGSRERPVSHSGAGKRRHLSSGAGSRSRLTTTRSRRTRPTRASRSSQRPSSAARRTSRRSSAPWSFMGPVGWLIRTQSPAFGWLAIVAGIGSLLSAARTGITGRSVGDLPGPLDFVIVGLLGLALPWLAWLGIRLYRGWTGPCAALWWTANRWRGAGCRTLLAHRAR